MSIFFIKIYASCSSILSIGIRSVIHSMLIGKKLFLKSISSVKSRFPREIHAPGLSYLKKLTCHIRYASHESSFYSRLWSCINWQHSNYRIIYSKQLGNLRCNFIQSFIGQRTVSYFHLEFSFSSRSGQHDERCDLLHYTRSFYRGHWIGEESSSGSGKRRKTPGMIFFKMSRKRSRTLMVMLFAY